MPKTIKAGSLAKPTGSNQPMSGSGSRGTSKPKLQPTTADAQWSREGLLDVPSNPTRGMPSPTRNEKKTGSKRGSAPKLSKASGTNKPKRGNRGPRRTGK